jgi:hypothetical protein
MIDLALSSPGNYVYSEIDWSTATDSVDAFSSQKYLIVSSFTLPNDVDMTHNNIWSFSVQLDFDFNHESNRCEGGAISSDYRMFNCDNFGGCDYQAD